MRKSLYENFPFDEGIKYLFFAAVFLAIAILFHLGHTSFWPDAAAQEPKAPMAIIFALAALGYGLTGLSKLLKKSKPELADTAESVE